MEEGVNEVEAGIVAAETVAALGQRWGELQKLVLLAELLGEQQHAVCCAPYLLVHGEKLPQCWIHGFMGHLRSPYYALKRE